MGFFSKVWKGIKTSFIGKAIRSGLKRFGKFMNKIGVAGQLAMSLLLPGVGGMMSKLAEGMINYAGFASGVVNGAGHFLNVAANVGSRMKTAIGNVTKGVTDLIKNTMGGIGDALGIDKFAGKLGITSSEDWLDKFKFGQGKLTKDIEMAFARTGNTLFGKQGLFSKDTLTSTYSSRLRELELFKEAQGLSGVGEFKVNTVEDMFKDVSLKDDLSLDLTSQVQGEFGKVGQSYDQITKSAFDGLDINNIIPKENVLQTEKFMVDNTGVPGFDFKPELENQLQRSKDFYTPIEDSFRVTDKGGVKLQADTTLPDTINPELNVKSTNIGSQAPADSLLTNPQASRKSVVDGVKKRASGLINDFTNVITDKNTRNRYIAKTGDKFVQNFVGSLATGGADRLIYGDREAPKYTSVNLSVPSLEQAEIGFSPMSDNMFSASQFQSNMLSGNMYGAPSAWWDWQQWASDFRASEPYRQNVLGATK